MCGLFQSKMVAEKGSGSDSWVHLESLPRGRRIVDNLKSCVKSILPEIYRRMICVEGSSRVEHFFTFSMDDLEASFVKSGKISKLQKES